MKLRKEPDYFLVTEHENIKDQKFIYISPKLAEQMDKWGVRTKIASCFRIQDDELSNDEISLTPDIYLFFVGPIAIAKLSRPVLKGMAMWLTYGAYNLIVATYDIKQAENFSKYLDGQSIRYEKWKVNENQIIDYNISCHELEKRAPLSRSLFDKYASDPVMLPVVREYYMQILTTCERLRYIDKTAYKRMLRFHEAVNEYVQLSDGFSDDSSDDSFQNFNYLTSINACLTRYNSQMISGFSPILEQETHAWSHSLLGMGMASLAINNIGDFFYDKVGNQRIEEKFAQILSKKYTFAKSIVKSSAKDPVFDVDHIGDEVIVNGEIQMPLLIFFSSRDGFRNQYNTLSIPLISLYGCNTPGWSLKTISHEASHLLVDSVLDYLFKNLQDTDWQKKFCIISSPKYVPLTYDEAILQSFGAGLIALSIEEGVNYDAVRFKKAFETCRDEMKEIMTHAFDFLYFYQSNVKDYIEEIWATWGELPRISSSIPGYVMRSLCIIVLSDWKVKNIEEKAIDALREQLVMLLGKARPVFKNNYLQDAIDYIDKNREDREGIPGLISLLVRRKFLIKFVKGFLFSTKIHSAISHESYALGSKSLKESLESFGRLEISEAPFNNPLCIAERYSRSAKLSEAESCLIYYNLAFNYVRDKS